MTRKGDKAPPGVGRPKGRKNWISPDVHEAVLQAANNKGGVQYLERLADTEPRAFVALLARCMPQRIEAEHSGEIILRWKGE